MLLQRILTRAPACLRCFAFSRTFHAFNKSHRHRLDELKNSTCFNRRNVSEQSIFNVNTSVPKDVVLYKSSGDRTYKMISIFSIVQFGFWLTVADTYNALLKEKPKENNDSQSVPWLDKLKTQGKIVTLGIPIGCLCMGTMLIAICFVYTLKSVKTLVLCKGGNDLSITSFGFFNRNITTTIPLETISCAVGRNDRGQSIPLKVKGKWFHYTLDKNGQIYNPQLFDLTAGLRRNI